MIVYILYSCDCWHTSASRFLHGVFTSKDKAMEALVQLLEDACLPELSKDDLRNLSDFGQTQGYSGEGEFMLYNAWLDKIDTWLLYQLIQI